MIIGVLVLKNYYQKQKTIVFLKKIWNNKKPFQVKNKALLKIKILNKSLKLTVSNAGVRSVDKKGSFDQFIKGAKTKNLSFRLKKLKKSLLSKSA